MPKTLMNKLEEEASGSDYEVVDRIDYSDGIKMYLKGHPYPLKGNPTLKAVGAINKVKKLIRFPSKKNIHTCIRILAPHVLSPAYQQPMTKELQKIIPGNIGFVLSYIMEYDSAYRLRVQDLLTSANITCLWCHPITQLWALLAINKRRDYPAVHKKFRTFVILLTVLLWWPPFRKKWRDALNKADFKNLILDEADRYWLDRRTDYRANA